MLLQSLSSIDLNNAAVELMSETGDIQRGLQLLLDACSHQNQQSKSKSDGSNDYFNLSQKENGSSSSPFEYSFRDCSHVLPPSLMQRYRSLSLSLDESTPGPLRLPMSIHFLKIHLRTPEKQDENTFSLQKRRSTSMVLGYNLSIVCTLIGMEHGLASPYIQKALALLDPIHRNILKRKSTSRIWNLLQLSVLNNYIFILHLCFKDNRRAILALEYLIEKATLSNAVHLSQIRVFERNVFILRSIARTKTRHCAMLTPLFSKSLAAAGAA